MSNTITFTVSRLPRICQMPNCKRPIGHKRSQLCRAHRAKQLKYGDPSVDKSYTSTQLNLPFCQHDGCKNKPTSGQQKYCAKHQRNISLYGNADGLSRIDRFKKLYAENTKKLPNGCILLRGRCPNSRGYTPMVGLDGKTTYAHRISHQVFNLNGHPIPDGVYTLHDCDNAFCINPKHLRSGSAQDNANDRKARNRFLGTTPRGKTLSTEIVSQVKLALMNGETGYSLAKRFNVRQPTISQIKLGRSHYGNGDPKGWKPFPLSKPGRSPKAKAA